MRIQKLIFLFCFISASSFGFQNTKSVAKWVIKKGCSLQVMGTTNINKFNCAIYNYYEPDTLNIITTGANDAVRISGKMALGVSNFDCYNPVMTSDLRKTLKAKEFPYLTINFVSLSKYPNFKQKSGEIEGKVRIELAGVSRQFDVHYRFVSNNTNSLTLVGTRKVNFSDFKIIPPRKLGGMIQTDDELDIEFSLQLKVLDQ